MHEARMEIVSLEYAHIGYWWISLSLQISNTPLNFFFFQDYKCIVEYANPYLPTHLAHYSAYVIS